MNPTYLYIIRNVNLGDAIPTEIPTSKILRQAKSSTIIAQRLHEDPIISLSILKYNDQLGSAIRDIEYIGSLSIFGVFYN